MDRRVKERLIGASILVALLVLVVPELLSGPKPASSHPPMLPAATPEPIRNVTVDLSTSKAPTNPDQEPGEQAASAATPDANQPSAAPQVAMLPNPAPSSPAAAGTPAAGSPAARQAAARTAAVESSAPSPISSGRGWSVQLGSFASRVNADNLSRQIKGQGFPAFVLPGGSGSAVRYRVRVGPLTDRESAERMAAKLKSLGHVSSLVGPAG
jgi:DedD protein